MLQKLQSNVLFLKEMLVGEFQPGACVLSMMLSVLPRTVWERGLGCGGDDLLCHGQFSHLGGSPN